MRPPASKPSIAACVSRRQVRFFQSDGPIAQGLEQATHNRLVECSNHSSPTILTTFGWFFYGWHLLLSCVCVLIMISRY